MDVEELEAARHRQGEHEAGPLHELGQRWVGQAHEGLLPAVAAEPESSDAERVALRARVPVGEAVSLEGAEDAPRRGPVHLGAPRQLLGGRRLVGDCEHLEQE